MKVLLIAVFFATVVAWPKGAHRFKDTNYWLDCKGEINGTTAIDDCGTCGGHNESCIGCDGVINSGKVLDCSGECGGTKIRDCFGKCGGRARLDCMGVCMGKARIDLCGNCNGNNECVGCDGVANSGKVKDVCGRCGGDGSSCVDCAGIPYGTTKTDKCGICGGNDDCLDCLGVPNGTAVVDVCGDCNGDGQRCLGCDGVAFSQKTFDMCGICGGDSSTCCGQNGECSGHGICIPEQGCACDLGWTLRFCSMEQDLCQLNPCGPHGRCTHPNGDCICEEGWDGDACTIPTCSGHGNYDRVRDQCNCFAGYYGSNCDTCTSHPLNHKGQPITDITHVCFLKEEAFYHDPKSNVPMYNGPLRFSLTQVKTSDVELLLNGAAGIARKQNRKVILPGNEFNGHIYGCDCLPAIPDDRVYKQIGDNPNERDVLAYEGTIQTNMIIDGHVASNGAKGKFYTETRSPQARVRISNATQLHGLLPSDRFFHFREGIGETYRNIMKRSNERASHGSHLRAPANLTQLQTYADRVSDIFNLKIDAATDDASVLLASTSDIKEEVNFYKNFGPYFMAFIWIIVWIVTGLTFVGVCFIWQSKQYLSAFLGKTE